jgi:hypothetical protein
MPGILRRPTAVAVKGTYGTSSGVCWRYGLPAR